MNIKHSLQSKTERHVKVKNACQSLRDLVGAIKLLEKFLGRCLLECDAVYSGSVY